MKTDKELEKIIYKCKDALDEYCENCAVCTPCKLQTISGKCVKVKANKNLRKLLKLLELKTVEVSL